MRKDQQTLYAPNRARRGARDQRRRRSSVFLVLVLLQEWEGIRGTEQTLSNDQVTRIIRKETDLLKVRNIGFNPLLLLLDRF